MREFRHAAELFGDSNDSAPGGTVNTGKLRGCEATIARLVEP